MGQDELLKSVQAKAQNWLANSYDEETRQIVQNLLDDQDPTNLIEAFYKDLEFGTGGLRGIMGVGSNRMNKYTVGAATQGLANYLKQEFASLPQIAVVIGHDCRNNSPLFAKITAEVLSANESISFRKSSSYTRSIIRYSRVGLPKWCDDYSEP